MTQEEYAQFKAYARLDGLYVALVWIGSFACYIYGLTSPLTSIIAMIAAVASPFYAAKRLRKFRDEARQGMISFAQAMMYYLSIFMYAALIFAMAQYIYFAFIDNGYLANTCAAMLSTPESELIFKAYGMTKQQVDDSLAAFREASPILIAVNILTMNVFIGLILSIPAALIMKRQPASNE